MNRSKTKNILHTINNDNKEIAYSILLIFFREIFREKNVKGAKRCVKSIHPNLKQE